MISEAEIMKKLRKWAATPYGKEEIKRVYGIDYKPRKDPDNIRDLWANKMKRILYLRIKDVIRSIKITDIKMGEFIRGDDGRYSVVISLDNVHRKSLDSENYDGVEDIVLQFARGWKARGAIHGEWRGKKVWSRRTRNSNPFMRDAVQEFNEKAKGAATAKLIGDYAKL